MIRKAVAAKLAEQVVGVAAREAGKHLSRKAVDKTVATGRSRLTEVYDDVRFRVDSFLNPRTGVAPFEDEVLTSHALSATDQKILKDWYIRSHAPRVGHERALAERLFGELL